MKITKTQLKEIIKEELGTLTEADEIPESAFERHGVAYGSLLEELNMLINSGKSAEEIVGDIHGLIEGQLAWLRGEEDEDY